MTLQTSILIVDDEPNICEILFEQLQNEGYRCDIAADATTALCKIKLQIYDIILIDINLPDISGLELLKKMLPTEMKPVIIMVTANSENNIIKEAFRLGASDFIIKPFNFGALNSSINASLRRKELESRIDQIHSGISAISFKQASTGWISIIDAISQGIDMGLDDFDRRSRIILERTIATARSMGLPEEVITEWAETRSRQMIEKKKLIITARNKLYKNPVAQLLLGFTEKMDYNSCKLEYSN